MNRVNVPDAGDLAKDSECKSWIVLGKEAISWEFDVSVELLEEPALAGRSARLRFIGPLQDGSQVSFVPTG